MNTLELILAACGGAALAIFYFVGLWWTIRCLPQSRHPIATYFASLVARLAVTLFALGLLIVSTSWQTIAAGLCGFMLVRLLLVHTLGSEPAVVCEADPHAIDAGSLE